MKRTRASSAVDRLLEQAPFGLDEQAQKGLFSEAIQEAFRHHLQNNQLFREYCLKKGVTPERLPSQSADYPFLPVALFKNRQLSSVPEAQIKMVLSSSATTGTPSTVPIDAVTSRRQMFASAKVIADYLGPNRRPFLILDEDPTQSRSTEISARSAATRGFLPLASSVRYFLKTEAGGLTLDSNSLKEALKEYSGRQQEICLFGFTYLLYYHVIKVLKEQGNSFRLPASSKIVHIGGWKKLEAQKVTRAQFLSDIQATLGVGKEAIVDFYGFTEQMGLVYANQGDGPKTVPAYAQLIVRDFQTLAPAQDGQEGLIQILTPLPHSYPGISVLTEDVGRILGRGKGADGRWGTRFEIVGRAKKAEARGCGDILAEIIS